VSEYHFEPIRGLPGLLPRGERILWQGAPDWVSLARRAFLGGPVAIYFAVLMAWRFVDGVAADGVRAAAIHALWLGLVGVVALAVISLLAWATAKSTVYTITNRRVVLRVGVALTMSVNVPFKRVVSAGLKPLGGDLGDVSMQIGGEERFSFLMLWPHVRPWRWRKPEPTMRSLPDSATVARILAEALVEYQKEQGVEAIATIPASAADKARPRPSGGLVPAE
jgi:hypothetical protein